jgi:4-amino-4-deoxy-L-arabinose transferase-like glycosyltransferase
MLIILIWLFLHAFFFFATPIYAPPDTFGYEEIAGILLGFTPFPSQGLGHPPGYPLVMIPLYSLFKNMAYPMVIIQHIAILLSGLMLMDIGTRLGNLRIGFASALFVVCSPTLLTWAHILYTEVLTSFALVMALWSAHRAVSESRRIKARWVVLASLALVWAGLTRQVPYLLAIPVTVFLWFSLHSRGGVKQIISSLLPVFICAIAFFGWNSYIYTKGGEFEHTNRPGRHLYNRIVYTDKTLAKGKPHTDHLLTIMSEEEALQPHWHVHDLLMMRGLTFREANELMTRVSFESLRRSPL